MEHLCHLTCFGPSLACGWLLNNPTRETAGRAACTSPRTWPNPSEVMTRFPWASPRSDRGPEGTCLSNLSILRLSHTSQNIGKVPGAGIILRTVPTFWDTTLEKPPVSDSLNTLHSVINVNKAQMKNLYIKNLFHGLQYCGLCLHAGWKCYQANIFLSVDFMHQEKMRI